MIKLIIENIVEYDYSLKDKDNNKYRFNIQFYDLDNKPKVGDSLFVHEKLLDDVNYVFSFGPIDGEYGRDIMSSNDSDIVVLVMGNEKIYLKKYYG